jgi:hypothetical protein
MSKLEETLSEMNRQPLPPEWKRDLIEGALSAAEERIVEKEKIVFLPGVFPRILLASIAACWVAIAAFHFATPKGPGPQELAERFGIEQKDLPFLARRIGIPSNFSASNAANL